MAQEARGSMRFLKIHCFHKILLAKHGFLLHLIFTSISVAPSRLSYIISKLLSCHTLYHVLTWGGEGGTEDGCAAVKEPTHGERLCGVAVANTVAAPAAAATRNFQMILASSPQTFNIRPQALGTDTRHLHCGLCLNSWATEP